MAHCLSVCLALSPPFHTLNPDLVGVKTNCCALTHSVKVEFKVNLLPCAIVDSALITHINITDVLTLALNFW